MKGSSVRLFEHIKLLQRSVEISQQGKIFGVSAADLRRGLNDQPVRIGLLGATSAGKTTLIRRILSDSAGKISSKPETACLVVHSFSKAENVIFRLKDSFKFLDSKTSSAFREFVKSFDLLRSFERVDDCSWQSVEHDVTKEFDREEILEFFAQVNDFDGVFESIKWNHKRRRSECSLSDLIDIYDLPGFGGKDAHDETASNVIEKEEFDVLIYLIDSSKGIPANDEVEHLHLLQRLLEQRSSLKMYWAYEKPLPEGVDLKVAEENIRSALVSMDVQIDAPILDLTGFDADDEHDDVSARILRDVLRPYFVEAGKSYYDKLFNSAAPGNGDALKNAFESIDATKSLIDTVLEEIDQESKKKDSALPCKEAANSILKALGVDSSDLSAGDEHLPGVSECSGYNLVLGYIGMVWDRVKCFCESCNSSPTKECNQEKPVEMSESCNSSPTKECNQDKPVEMSDREVALKKMALRLQTSVRKIVCAITSDVEHGSISIDKVRRFRKEVYAQDSDLRTLVYDAQFYLMLKDYESVRGYVMKPIVDSLRANMKREIDDIEGYSEEDE